MERRDIKLFVIHNTKPIYQSVHILFQNPDYQNHLEYWQEYLSSVEHDTVSLDDLYKDTRNMVAVKIAMEGNIVFMDTSKKDSDYRSGVVFLPSEVSYKRKKIAFELVSSYNYLNIIYDIHYNGKSYYAKEKDFVRSTYHSKVLTYHS